jgi:hypothetical protein
MVTGSISGQLRHATVTPSYGGLVVDLPRQTGDASLALPDGTNIRGGLEILNTNNHSLTLLASTSPRASVIIRALGLNISGDTKIALAKATGEAPATSYRLSLQYSYVQSSGNFSLQDFDGALGTSTLDVGFNLIQTGGTFYTNSTAIDSSAKFILEMSGPSDNSAGPSGIFTSWAQINMSSGTIDNGRGMVTLRINSPGYNPSVDYLTTGVDLRSPLEVGKLELLLGPLNTTSTNIITVTNPATEILTGRVGGRGYVNGPIRRVTNSMQPYVFPTGKGNNRATSYVPDFCTVIPATSEPSIYQAEYFRGSYPDTQNRKLPLAAVSPSRYWNISKISGADASVQLTVRGRLPNATNSDVLVVARYADGEWISEQGSVLPRGDTTAGSVVSRPLSEFGAFTLGYYPQTAVTPVFVNCPPDTTITTNPGSCSALLHFKAESTDNATVVYRIGSTVITSPYQFPKGVSVVEVTASNASGAATCSFSVTVNDKEAPIIYGPFADPASLSPADDAFRQVHISYTPEDNCGKVTTTLSVTSNQSHPGITDWEIIGDHYVRLRASASGEDRVYTITITAIDESGNQSAEQVTVSVPKEKADKKIKLKVKVMPNPTKTYFTLQVRSKSDKPITMQVFDHFGRVQEVRRLYADATIQLGDGYIPGVYLVKLTQGKEEVNLKLLKLPEH